MNLMFWIGKKILSDFCFIESRLYTSAENHVLMANMRRCNSLVSISVNEVQVKCVTRSLYNQFKSVSNIRLRAENLHFKYISEYEA